MLSREEKKKKVVELRKKGKTIRQIAKAVQMGFGEIGEILRENFPEEEIKTTLQQSRYTKALELIDNNKSQFEVAVQLHLTYDEVEKINKDYLKLRNRDRLGQIYQDLGDNLEPFLILHDTMKEAGKTPGDAILISNHINQLTSLKLSCNEKSRELTGLQATVQTLTSNCQELSRQQGMLQYNNSILSGQNQNLNCTNQSLNGQLSQLQNSIQYLRNVGPDIVKSIAEQEIQSTLARKRETLSVAIGAVFQTILQDPSKMLLINSLSEMEMSNPSFQGELEFYRNEFLDLAEKAYENLSFQCAKGIVDFILHRESLSGIKITSQSYWTSNY
jgi:hypothetical protein